MVETDFRVFPAFGEPYIAIYRGGPLGGQSEARQSVGHRLFEIMAGDEMSDSKYVLWQHADNGRDAVWIYDWASPEANSETLT